MPVDIPNLVRIVCDQFADTDLTFDCRCIVPWHHRPKRRLVLMRSNVDKMAAIQFSRVSIQQGACDDVLLAVDVVVPEVWHYISPPLSNICWNVDVVPYRYLPSAFLIRSHLPVDGL